MCLCVYVQLCTRGIYTLFVSVKRRLSLSMVCGSVYKHFVVVRDLDRERVDVIDTQLFLSPYMSLENSSRE
jgi:hypothetical protein